MTIRRLRRYQRQATTSPLSKAEPSIPQQSRYISSTSFHPSPDYPPYSDPCGSLIPIELLNSRLREETEKLQSDDESAIPLAPSLPSTMGQLILSWKTPALSYRNPSAFQQLPLNCAHSGLGAQNRFSFLSFLVSVLHFTCPW